MDPKDNKEKTPNAATPLEHPGRPVFVLIPWVDSFGNTCKDFLQPLLRKCATEPKILADLPIGLFRGDEVLYVCHTRMERVKQSDGSYDTIDVGYLSKPIDVRELPRSDQEYGLGGPNLAAVSDAVSHACSNQRNGRVFYAQLSADKEPQKKRLKLLGS